MTRDPRTDTARADVAESKHLGRAAGGRLNVAIRCIRLGEPFDAIVADNFKVFKWRLTSLQLGGIWELKTIGFINDCLNTFTPYLVGVG